VVFCCLPAALFGQATLTSPAAGSTLAGSSVTFTWTAGTGTTSYDLWLGLSGPGSSSLYNSGWLTATSTTVTTLPAKGATVYARLYSEGSEGEQYSDYIFTEATSAPAALISPTAGGVLGASNEMFTWTAGAEVTKYDLWLGLSGPGSSSLYNSGWLTTTSTTVTTLPAKGATVYARLYSLGSGGEQYNDYTYTEAGGALLSAFSCTSASMTGSGTDACTVTLNAAAPSGGLAVSLSSSNLAATVPATVTVPASATSMGFVTTVSSVGTAQPVTLTAVGGGVSETVALQLNADIPTLSVATSTSPSTYGGALTFTATISTDPTGSVTFDSGGVSIGTGTINGTTATLTTSTLTAGSHAITAIWAGNGNYGAASSGALTQVVNKATPPVSWNAPAAVAYGTALTSVQLDATSTVAGMFAYSPAAGTVLVSGSQTLSVTFTPTDATDYNTATATVAVTVNKVTPTITWATPGAITSGTALSSTQLNATASVAGSFAYSPASGTVLAAGAQTLTVIFTPTDTVDYNTASVSVTLTVNQGISTLSINATSVGFGNVALNQPATQTLTLSSTGSSSVTVNSAVLVGASFTLSGTAFPTTLAPGQTATVGVQFDPTVVGAASGTLTISSTSSSNPTATIALTGTGTAVSYAVDLSWDAPVGSTDPVAGYNIYRSPVGGSTYQLLNSSVEALTAYVDSTVQVATSYDYIVESVDASGVASVPTSPVAVTIP
jgi:Bacterial Ig-like domain (group 3)/Abnormal spindle-like microcephaly-assoc'd, ASPM-SPD-2-Hydin